MFNYKNGKWFTSIKVGDCMGTKGWLYINEEDLKSNFEDIKENLKDKEFLNINSFEDLLLLRNFLFGQFRDGYFKSERHMKAFLLSKYESNVFNKELGISRRHFVDKNLAKKWMTEMQSQFHPDRNQDILADIDFTKISEGINRAYGEMVGRK